MGKSPNTQGNDGAGTGVSTVWAIPIVDFQSVSFGKNLVGSEYRQAGICQETVSVAVYGALSMFFGL